MLWTLSSLIPALHLQGIKSGKTIYLFHHTNNAHNKMNFYTYHLKNNIHTFKLQRYLWPNQ